MQVHVRDEYEAPGISESETCAPESPPSHIPTVLAMESAFMYWPENVKDEMLNNRTSQLQFEEVKQNPNSTIFGVDDYESMAGDKVSLTNTLAEQFLRNFIKMLPEHRRRLVGISR